MKSLRWGGKASSASQAESEFRARFARGTAGAFTIKVVGTGISFLAQLVLARVLGVENYGIYAYVLAWITVLALLATLGFQSGLLRFASAYFAEEKWALLRGVVRYAETRVAAVGLAVTAAGVAIMVSLEEYLPTELRHTFLVGLMMVPALALLQLRVSLLRAFGKVVAALAPNLLWRNLLVLLGVGFLGVGLAMDVHAPLAMTVMLAGTILSFGIASFSLHHARPRNLQGAPLAEERAVWRSAAKFMLLLAGAQLFMERADVLLLGWFAGTTSAGIYTVAVRIAGLVAFVLAAVNIIFAPTISALYARGDRAGLQALVTMTAWWITLSAFVIASPLMIFAEFWLGFFGEAFVAGAGALRILLLGQLINAMAGSVSYLLMMTGNERQAAFIIVAASAGNIVLNCLLIPAFAMEGAAVANAVAITGWNVAMAAFAWRKLGLVPGILGSAGGFRPRAHRP